MIHIVLYQILSFIIVVAAQPDWSSLASILAASVGYALFWKGIAPLKRREQFLSGVLWMGTIQLIQINWLTSDHYVGFFIYAAVIFFAFAIGCQFGLLSLFVRPKMSVKQILGVAGAWVLMEWSRLFFLSGYTWNPVGLSLSATNYGIQMAAMCGIFGLSFWVILSNVAVYQKRWRLAAFLCLFPYLFGGVTYHWHHYQIEKGPKLEVLLVQHAVTPEKLRGMQWESMCAFLAPYFDKSVDLIVFPEAALPFLAHAQIYPATWVNELFADYFQYEVAFEQEYVSNAQIAQSIATLFQADVVVGLEDTQGEHNYNAAFHFSPDKNTQVYYKQVLLPFGEYLPFAFKWFEKYFPADGYFTPGKSAKVFEGKVPFGVSICYEETFGHLMRHNKRSGAHLLVNISNDVWYPHSRLPFVHYMHGRLRAVEMGVPLVRACNTGMTCGVDSLGCLRSHLPYETRKSQPVQAALLLSLPLHHYSTIYSYVGDYLILVISFGFLALAQKRRLR